MIPVVHNKLLSDEDKSCYINKLGKTNLILRRNRIPSDFLCTRTRKGKTMGNSSAVVTIDGNAAVRMWC